MMATKRYNIGFILPAILVLVTSVLSFSCRKRNQNTTTGENKYFIDGILMDSCDGSASSNIHIWVVTEHKEIINGKDSGVINQVECVTDKNGYFKAGFTDPPVKCWVDAFPNRWVHSLVIGEDIRNKFNAGIFSLGTIFFHGMSVMSNVKFYSDSGFKNGDMVILYDMNPPYEDHRDTFRGGSSKSWNVKTKLWYKTTYLKKSSFTSGFIFQTPYYYRKVTGGGEYLGASILTANTCQSSDKDTIEILLP